MRIGIAVVYMVSERNEALLDLHLHQIEKNTEHPYTIYACTNELLPQFKEILADHPRVKVCPCKDYPGRSALWRPGAAHFSQSQNIAMESKYEHSWYLEQLIHTAIEDGVTHIAMLHVDSFPIRPGWDQELISKFTDSCVLAGVTRDPGRDQKPLTAGILFTREFYLACQPRLLLSPEELKSEEYRRYLSACPHESDSGFGYGFTMFRKGLTWYSLTRSNRGGSQAMLASIHGDLIFHLHATVFIERTDTVGFSASPSQRKGLIGVGARIARAVLPMGVRRKVRARAKPLLQKHCESLDRKAWEVERQHLFDNPDEYIAYLRTGVR